MDLEQAAELIDEIVMTMEAPERIVAIQSHVDALAQGEVGRAEFLTSLAGELEVVGDFDAARTANLAAIDDGGPTELDPRCGLLSIELRSDQQDRAIEVLAELLAHFRLGLLSETECEWIADSLEEAGRLRDALRWFTLPLRDTDPEDVEQLPSRMLRGRHRVRRELDLPVDAYDEAWQLLDRLNA